MRPNDLCFLASTCAWKKANRGLAICIVSHPVGDHVGHQSINKYLNKEQMLVMLVMLAMKPLLYVCACMRAPARGRARVPACIAFLFSIQHNQHDSQIVNKEWITV